MKDIKRDQKYSSGTWVGKNYSIVSKLVQFSKINLAGNYMFKVNNRNTRTRCETCSKLIIKIPERRHWRHWTPSLWYLYC